MKYVKGDCGDYRTGMDAVELSRIEKNRGRTETFLQKIIWLQQNWEI